MKRRSGVALVLSLVSLTGQMASADPYKLQYGGRLTQSNGQPLSGAVSLVASFYASATGGASIASQTFNAIPLSDGVFNLSIELTPAEFHSVFSGSEAWIEIIDTTSGKIYPRQRFTAVPFAFKVPTDGSTIGYDSNGRMRVQGLAGQPLPSGSPADGQILKWRSGSGWEWGSDEAGMASGSIDSTAIQDGSISNVDIASGAAISGSKIVPNFGSQNITTTGVISGNGSGLTNLPAGPLGSSIDSSEIVDGTLVDADIAAGAAIAQSKINGLAAALASKEGAITAGTSTQYLRGDKSWATLDTSAIPENTNLYFTDARARAAISASAPLVYDSSTGVMSLPAATSVADGYLSASDWLSFSGKQAAITAASTVNTGSLTTALQNALGIKPYGSTAGEAGEIRFTEVTGSGQNYVGFKAPDSIGINEIWTLPAIDGSSGQVLTTNGSGVLSWTTGGGGGGGSSGTVTDITAGTGLSGGTITGSGVIDLADTAVTPGSYTRANITVDAQGRLTAAASGGSVNLASEVTGSLPVANGGTGSNTAGGARTNLGLGSLATLSAVSTSEITDGTIADADISGAAAIAQSKINGLTTSLAGKEPSITAGTSAQYFRGDKSWATLDTSVVPENTNLYFTDARARSALSGTAPVAFNSSTGAISMAAATSVANGYLSSGDWLTFNNKQAAITAASTVNTGTLTSALQNGLQLKPFGASAGEAGELRFTEVTGAGSNYIGFKAPDSITADKVWTLPAADGTSGQVLSTNGSGVLSWSSGNTGTVTSITAGTGLSGGTISGSGTINLANTAVSAGSYTRANITVDAQGRLTSAANGSNVNLTSEVTGTLPVGNGGTGLTSGTSGGVPYFSAASTLASSAALTANGVVLGGGAGAAPSSTAAGSANQVLRVPSGGGAPAFGALDVSQSAAVTGVLAVANGGTNSSTALNNNRIMVSSSGQIREAAALTNGQLLIGSSGAAPVAASLSQGSNGGVTISGGAGTLALDTVQDIRTTASPTFAGLSLSSSLTAASQVAGSSDNSATPGAGTLRSANGTGSNIAGANLTIAAGNGTGTGGSGSISFRTAPSGSTGSTANTLATRMTIDKTGNVGIGTTNPGSGISVISPGSVVSTSGWYSAYRSGEVGYQLFNGGGVAEWSIRQPASGTSNDLRISTLASGNIYDKMTITTQGNVGIGTTVPAATLDVRTGGDAMTGAVIHSWNGNPGGNGLLIKALDAAWSAASDYSFRIMDNNATVTRLTVNRDGNVGIGTTSPQGLLHVAGATTILGAGEGATPSAATLRGANATGTNIAGADLTIQASSGTGTGGSGTIRFQTAPSGSTGTTANTPATRMYIDKSGNIGIGTTTAVALLNIAKPIPNAPTSVSIANSYLHIGAAEGGSSALRTITFGYNTAGASYPPVYMGHLTTDMTNWENGALVFGTRSVTTDSAPSERLRIASDGNVGIGTTSPSYKLHVVGTAGLSSGTSWTNASDIRLKDVEGDYEYGLAEVKKLHTIRFRYKKDNPLNLPWSEKHTGFIAQEVREIIPDAVLERADGYLELNVDPIHWATVNAVQELADENDQLKAESAQLKAESAQLKAESAQLKAESAQLKARADKTEAESAQLKAESAQLKAESAQLKAESTQLKARADKAEAESDQMRVFLCTQFPSAPICK